VEELYNIVEVIHEENGQGETNTIVMGEWESMDDGWRKIIYIYTLFEYLDWKGEIGDVKCSSNF
jgi:hypothetical protein